MAKDNVVPEEFGPDVTDNWIGSIEKDPCVIVPKLTLVGLMDTSGDPVTSASDDLLHPQADSAIARNAAAAFMMRFLDCFVTR